MPSQRSVPFTATPWKVPEDRVMDCGDVGTKKINFRNSRSSIADATGSETLARARFDWWGDRRDNIRRLTRARRASDMHLAGWSTSQGTGVIGRPTRMSIEAIVTSGDTRKNKVQPSCSLSLNCWLRAPDSESSTFIS